jgi:DNA-binding response OmpR family regulator
VAIALLKGSHSLVRGATDMSDVLVLDKDQLQLDLFTFLLKQEGHGVHATSQPEVAFDVLRSRTIDLVIMETALPRDDGERIGRQIRQLNSKIPLMIVSETDKEEQILRGLTYADEYVTKPFAPRQFLARVHALIRRAGFSNRSGAQDENLSIGEIVLNLQRMQAIVNGKAVSLTPRGFSLLYALMDNPNRVLSRKQLMRLAWGQEFMGPKAVDVCILRLRKKIEPHLAGKLDIVAERGLGYRFVTPRSSVAASSR